MALTSHNYSFFFRQCTVWHEPHDEQIATITTHPGLWRSRHTHLMCQKRNEQDLTDFSGGKPSGPHMWENVRKVHAQIIQKEGFKHVHGRSETGMHTSVEWHFLLQWDIEHLHTDFSKWFKGLIMGLVQNCWN